MKNGKNYSQLYWVYMVFSINVISSISCLHRMDCTAVLKVVFLLTGSDPEEGCRVQQSLLVACCPNQLQKNHVVDRNLLRGEGEHLI